MSKDTTSKSKTSKTTSQAKRVHLVSPFDLVLSQIHTEFSAAHIYEQPKWSKEVNSKEFGLCYSEHGHGHGYQLDVAFQNHGRRLPVSLDLDLKKTIRSVLADYEHRHISFTHPRYLKGKHVPTTENIARVLWLELREAGLEPEGLALWEMDSLGAIVGQPIHSRILQMKTPGGAARTIAVPVTLLDGLNFSAKFTVVQRRGSLKKPMSVSEFRKTSARIASKCESREELVSRLSTETRRCVGLESRDGYFFLAGFD